jgi:hypothetical protein
METTDTKMCNRCKKTKNIIDFTKGNNILKSCYNCREIFKKSRNKTKCIHNIVKYYCKICNGSKICEHNKVKYKCKICGDEIKITIRHMLASSKKTDKQHNRYDLTNFIDKCFVKNLIEDCEDKCYYCKCELQYINYTDNLATIERIDNKLGHIKGNCVIACKSCNISKVGNKL